MRKEETKKKGHFYLRRAPLKTNYSSLQSRSRNYPTARSPQQPEGRSKQQAASEETTGGDRRAGRDEVKVTEPTTGAASFSEFIRGEKKKKAWLNDRIFYAARPLLDPFPSNGEQMEVCSRDQDSAITLFMSSILCSADYRRSASAQPHGS